MNADTTPGLLVVDDELGYREGIRRVLASRGYQAVTAASGAEAIDLVTRQDFAVVLVDLKMPGVDGFEVLNAVLRVRPSTLCVVVSAFATIESAVQTTKMGAFDFVVKPFVPDDLMVVVDRAVERWKVAREAERLRSERESHLLELSAEKSRLRTIVQSVAEGLLVVNVEGDVVLDNPVTRRLLGRVHLPRLEGPVKGFISDDKFLAEVDSLLAGEGPEVGITLEVRLPHGDDKDADRYLRATLASTRDEQGKVLGVVVLLADITDVKALERMKSLFVSMVAHELKAPIGAVEGYLNLMLAGTLDKDEKRRKEIISRCLQRTGALIQLIQDLTEITRRDTERRERRVGPVDLCAVCRDVVDFQRPLADQRHVTVTLELDEATRPVHADRGDLERVVTNLLSNAVKYNREGGSATVRVKPSGDVVTLEVSDTGIGMTEEERRRLGEEFFRAKNAKTRTITGTGLGVALVKKIVHGYAGDLEVESTPDQGSTFRVLLPLGAPHGSQCMEAA
jgi:signal transduction histidine kinase